MNIVTLRLALACISVASLAACDVATDIAGDAVKTEARDRFVEQCQAVSESAGIAADRIGQVCECSADEFMADEQLTLSDLNRERVEDILRVCADRTGASLDTASATEEPSA